MRLYSKIIAGLFTATADGLHGTEINTSRCSSTEITLKKKTKKKRGKKTLHKSRERNGKEFSGNLLLLMAQYFHIDASTNKRRWSTSAKISGTK